MHIANRLLKLFANFKTVVGSNMNPAVTVVVWRTDQMCVVWVCVSVHYGHDITAFPMYDAVKMFMDLCLQCITERITDLFL